MSLQDQYDEAMFDFTMGDYATAAAKLQQVVAADPTFFDAQLSLGMAWCRLGDFEKAIQEGHKAEALRPEDQLVYTNLSMFYMKAGNKEKAEHYGARAKVASWKNTLAKTKASAEASSSLPPNSNDNAKQ